MRVEEKSNEINAIPFLLRQLAFQGCLVTIDAMGTHPVIAAQIVEQGADYVLALKRNQELLSEEVAATFEMVLTSSTSGITLHRDERWEKGHGRREHRLCWLIDDPLILDYLNPRRVWKGLWGIGMVQATQQEGQKRTTETRYYLPGGRKNKVNIFAQAARVHWQIEFAVLASTYAPF